MNIPFRNGTRDDFETTGENRRCNQKTTTMRERTKDLTISQVIFIIIMFCEILYNRNRSLKLSCVEGGKFFFRYFQRVICSQVYFFVLVNDK